MKVLNYSSFCSFILLSLLSILFFIPIVLKHNNVSAVATQSETNLSITTPLDVSLAFEVDNKDGTFSSSIPSTFGVVTNNSSGYNLSIYPNATNTTTYDKLVNTEDDSYYFTSISSASSEAEFKVSNWGYKVTKTIGEINANTIDGTMYQPAPSTAGTILDITTTANSNKAVVEQDKYAITLGVKADYVHLPIGTYTNTFTLIAVANPVNYQVTYNKNTDDEVTNIPNTQAGDINNDDIVLSSTEPTRAHYSFLGWCNITPTTNNGVDSCTGTNATTYQPGDTFHLDKTKDNNLTLKAMWKIDQHTLTITKGSNISTTTGTGTYNYGQTVTLSATKTADTTCVGYSAPAWSRTSGTSTLSATSGNSITVTIKDNTTISVSSTASNKSQTVTLSRGTGVSSIKIGSTNYTASSVSLTCGNYSISGNYSSGYTFSAWSRANNVTVANTGAASTTMTVSGPGTLTLSAKATKLYMQNVTTSSCPTSRTLVYDSRDNKSYYIQKIGSLCWMTSNLAYASGASKVDSTYGGYYTWANAKSACPSGWSLPTKANYDTLISSYNTGAKLVAAPWYGAYGGYYYDGSASLLARTAATGRLLRTIRPTPTTCTSIVQAPIRTAAISPFGTQSVV